MVNMIKLANDKNPITMFASKLILNERPIKHMANDTIKPDPISNGFRPYLSTTRRAQKLPKT